MLMAKQVATLLISKFTPLISYMQVFEYGTNSGMLNNTANLN